MLHLTVDYLLALVEYNPPKLDVHSAIYYDTMKSSVLMKLSDHSDWLIVPGQHINQLDYMCGIWKARWKLGWQIQCLLLVLSRKIVFKFTEARCRATACTRSESIGSVFTTCKSAIESKSANL